MKKQGKPSVDRPWEKYYSAEVLEKELPAMTILEYIEQGNKKYPDRNAIDYFGRKITYGELFRNIEKTASALEKRGVKAGDIVTVAAPTLPEVIYLFYALSKIGAVANMVDPRTSSEGIKGYLEEVGSNYLFIVDVALPKVRDIKVDSLKEIITISPADSLPFALNLGYKGKEFFAHLGTKKPGDPVYPVTKWSAFFETGDIRAKKSDPYYKEKPVVIVHTGGTTGKPKGVILSHDNLNSASFQCQIAGFDFKREHRWLNIMPPFIAYGVGNGLHLPLAEGMEVILIPQFDPKEFDKLLVKYRPEHMTGVPSHYGHLLNSKDKKFLKDDLSYIIAPTIGGDRMDTTLEEETNRFLSSHGCSYKIVKGYGLSEVSAAVAACTSNENNELGSVGIPFSHTIISIFDPETGEELGYNELGEICITGPNTMVAYYDNPEETKAIKRVHDDGKVWVHSGDIGYMTEDGILYVVDRIKRMIIRHDGFKVFPSMIEDVILSHPKVIDCSVVGIPDTDYRQGKLPKAHIVLSEPEHEEEMIREIKLLCLENIPEYAIPVDYVCEDYIPLTPIGKVDYQFLEEKDLKEMTSPQKIKRKA